MTYRLESPTEDGVPDALRACAAEQLADAIQVLREERGADPVEAVHDARKDLKKARSLLRLARTDMPRKRYRAENAALREVARRLSDVRDADVLVETVDALAERFVGQLPREAFTTVRERFVTTADAVISDDVLEELAAIGLRVPEWPLDDCDARSLCAGATLAYARGRERFAVAEADASVENLHEWRKRVKDLWYHARLLEGAWPVLLTAYSEEAHSLSDHLGDDHDLAVLAERLAEGTWPPAVDAPALIELTARRRLELQQAAFALGQRLYAERPKAFGRRLGAYLRAA